jgi:hypothetical protein
MGHWRICIPVITDSHHFDEDPEPHQNENSDPDPNKSEKMDPEVK